MGGTGRSGGRQAGRKSPARKAAAESNTGKAAESGRERPRLGLSNPEKRQDGVAAAGMNRSVVVRRVPPVVRRRLDRAILLRPKGLATLEAMDAALGLSGFGVSAAALRAYARRLERMVRPQAMSQLLAEALGCLPAAFREGLLAGGQVLLLSRVVRALADEKGEPLAVADLVRLGTVLSKLSPVRRGSRRAGRSIKGRRDAGAGGGTELAGAIRAVYGLDWPAESPASPGHDE